MLLQEVENKAVQSRCTQRLIDRRASLPRLELNLLEDLMIMHQSKGAQNTHQWNSSRLVIRKRADEAQTAQDTETQWSIRRSLKRKRKESER